MLRVVELYCGIGGAAAALGPHAVSVGAFDISAPAIAVYKHNFPAHRAEVRLIDGLPASRLRALEADLFWLSPPCQPYTRRGHQRHQDDPRAATLEAALALIVACLPPYVALENVVGFESSLAREKLLETLAAAGYETREWLLCPSELGWPNRRPRYYLVAARKPNRLLPVEPGPAPKPLSLAELLAESARDLTPDETLLLEIDAETQRRYEGALHRVNAADEGALTTCFTAAYGRSFVRSGSYLELPEGRLRRFSPREVLRLLGFPAAFGFPPALGRDAAALRLAYRLAGNSLSLPAVRVVLASIPGTR